MFNFEFNFCYENKFYCESEKKKYIIEFNYYSIISNTNTNYT